MIPRWYYRELGPGDSGRDVAVVARKLATLGSDYTDELCARVRGVQTRWKLPVTGVVDVETAKVLGERSAAGQVPEWLGDPEREAQVLASTVGDADALRRFQGAYRLPVTGVLDADCATLLADVYCL